MVLVVGFLERLDVPTDVHGADDEFNALRDGGPGGRGAVRILSLRDVRDELSFPCRRQ